MRRSIIAGMFVVAFGVHLPLLLAQPDIEISNLAALVPSGFMTQRVEAGEEFWGVGMVLNAEQDAQNVTWDMTLDENEISYGGWLLPPGQQVLFTSISSSTVDPGIHFLDLTVRLSATGEVVAQSTVRILAR